MAWGVLGQGGLWACERGPGSFLCGKYRAFSHV